MLKFSSTGATLAKFALGLTMAATLAACGGGGGGAPAASITVSDLPAVTIDSTTATAATAALTAAPTGFSFPNGVPALGTAAVATTVTFTAPAAGATAPGFSIAAGTGTAEGTLAFGSCIFNVATSTIPGIVAPTTITVSPCAFDADTGGNTVTQGGTTTLTTSSVLVLGTGTTSAPADVTVTITNSNGINTITVNGGSLGTVTGTIATGATGAGS